MHADVGLVGLNSTYANSALLYGMAHGTNSVASGFAASLYQYNPSTYNGTSLGPFVSDGQLLGGAETIGEWVNKVGQTSGWTTGQIQLIQDQQSKSGRWIVGSIYVAAGVGPGDSGAPVWIGESYISGNPRGIYDGVLWGSNGTCHADLICDHFSYSPEYNVRQQLEAYGYHYYTYPQ